MRRPVLILTVAALATAGVVVLGAHRHHDAGPVAHLEILTPSTTRGAQGQTGTAPAVSILATPGAVSGQDPQQAALRFLESTEEVVALTPNDAAGVQRGISTAEAADRLAADVEVRMTRLVGAVPGGVRVWVAPIACRGVPTGNGYAVSIWYAEVVAAATDSVTVIYKTITYDLRYEGGSWKMQGSTVQPGPTPTPAPGAVTSPAELLGVLDGFDDTVIDGGWQS